MPTLRATLRSGHFSGFRFKLRINFEPEDVQIGKSFEAEVLEADEKFKHLVGKTATFHPEIISEVPALHFSR